MPTQLLAAILLFASAAAQACGPFTVALYEHGSLYSRHADGEWSGADKDVVEEVGRRTGCTFNYTRESRVRIWSMIFAGKLDMTVSAIATPEREQYVRVLPYIGTRNLVLLHKDVDHKVHSLADFTANPAYKVGVIKTFRHGATYDAWIDTLRAQGRVYEVADQTALMRMLKLGRVHAVIALQTSWIPMRREPDSKSLRAMEWAPKDLVVGGLAVSKERVTSEVTDKFAAALRAMREDGALEAIYRRYVDPATAATLVQY
jgi:polar amino acid transport system substrate-binding protein